MEKCPSCLRNVENSTWQEFRLGGDKGLELELELELEGPVRIRLEGSPQERAHQNF